MPYSLGAPASGTHSGLAVFVHVTYSDGSSQDGTGILIDQNHVLTAAHVVSGASVSSISVKYLYYEGSSAEVRSGVVSSIHELQGNWTGATPANIPKDIAVFRLNSPISLADDAFVGLSAQGDGAHLSGLNVTAYGYPMEATNRDGPEDADTLPDVDPGKLATTSGTIGSASGGIIYPVAGTQDYTGQSGSGFIVTDPAVADPYIAGVMNFRDGNSTYHGGGTYLTPDGLTGLMNALKADGPIGDAANYPKNFWFAANSGSDLGGSWRRDELVGEAGADTLGGLEADDDVKGNAGNDVLDGGLGNDTLQGGGDNDSLTDAGGEDRLLGGAGDDTVSASGEGGDNIFLGAGNDVLRSAASGTQVWGEAGNDTIAAADNVRFMDAEAGDRAFGASGVLLTGGLHWKASGSAYAITLNGQFGYGKNHVGDLVVRDFVGDYLAADGRSEFFIAGYVGGPGAPYNAAGIYVADAELGAYRMFEERPSHLDYFGGWAVLAGGLAKANFGVSFWAEVDPLILDLDGDGLELTAISGDDLVFDIDGDGYAEPGGWVRPDDGLLALDANTDGQINDIGELFGGRGASGFAELATHDDNADGVINSSDAVFANLRVWQDLDQDRHVGSGELKTLSELGITSLSVTGTPASATNATNQITATGAFTRAGAGTGVISDVNLVADNQNTLFLGDQSISSAAAALPELKGYGTLTDLRVAMTLDPTLQAVVSANLANLSSLDLPTLRAAALPILTAWAEASPVTGRPPLLAHDSVPLLIRIVDGRETVADFAYQPDGTSYWRLASGTSVKDGGGNVIAEPTLTQVQTDTHLQGSWSDLSGDTIAFFERYVGELMPLDTAPSGASQVLSQMTDLMDGFWTLQNSMAVRLAMQGPLAAFFPGLRYDVEKDGFYATTPQQLVPSFEAIFNEVKALSSGQVARLEAWERILNVVIADYHQQPDELLNTHGFLFSNIVAAYESTGLGLGLLAIADALGIPADLVRTGSGALTGGADADLFYLSSGNQTTSGGLGPDTYVVGGGFGQDVIDEFEGAGNAASEDVVRFANIDSTDVTARREGIDLIISVNGTTDELRIKNHFDGRTPQVGGGGDLSDSTGVDFIIFADGVTWTPMDVARAVSRPEAGAQTLSGTETVDWLDGGGGNDSLTGGNDADVYVYGRGYGTDTIRDGADHVYLQGPDTIVFKTDVSIADVHFSRIGNSSDLIVQIDGESGSLVVTEQFLKAYTGAFGGFQPNMVESFRAADGAFSADEVMQIILDQGRTNGDDTIHGFSREDVISGGAGNDYLSGANENDTYRYDLGDGHDTIEENPDNIISGLTDQVAFGEGIDPEAVTVRRIVGTGDAELTFSDGGTLVVRDQFVATATGPFGTIWLDAIEQFTFDAAPATTWTAEFVMQQALTNAQTSGADTIEGYWRQDTLDGGAGNDRLSGVEESDTYVFGRGYGHDTIDEGVPNLLQATDTDYVSLLPGVATTDVVFERSGLSDDFTLRIIGTDDRLTIIAQNDRYGSHQVEEVHFDGGAVWTAQFMREEFLRRAATAGADTVNGFSVDDTLAGGLGDDQLAGGERNDTYQWARGDGSDTITEGVDAGSADKLVLAGVNPSDVTVTRSGDDAILTIAGTGGGTIRLVGNIDEVFDRGVDQLLFANGAVWTRADLRSHLITHGGTPGDDTIAGSNAADTLSGGAGNDALSGGAGDDTYLWSRGDGSDTLTDGVTEGDNDTLVLNGINPGDVTLARNGGDVLLTVSGTDGGVLRLVADIDETFSQGVDRVVFANGTVWTRADFRHQLITLGSTAAADTITGSNVGDTLVGGAGNDSLNGAAGSDTYQWARGDGSDTITDGVNGGAADTLALSGVNPGDVVLSQTGNDILFTIGGADGGVLRLVAAAANTFEQGVDRVTFADGTVWTRSDLLGGIVTHPGTAGADTINGSNGADVIQGGAGNDVLNGGGGDDTYRWSRGDGSDTVTEGGFGGATDRLILLAVPAADVGVSRAGNDVILTISGADGGTIRLVGEIPEAWDQGVDQIVLTDATWSRADLRTKLLAQLSTSGADTITGFDAADTLAGGGGNDSLSGGYGDDSYYWSRGDGSDTISESNTSGTADRLVLTGVAAADVTVTRSGGDALITVGGAGGGTIRVPFGLDEFLDRGVEQVVLTDATWTRADLRAKILAASATSGADTITGFNTNDTLSGGAGNDALSGEAGNDTYIWSRGDGSDTISDGNTAGTADRLVLSGVAAADVTVSHSGSDALLTVGGANGGVIRLTFALDEYLDRGLEQIVLTDATWTRADLRLKALETRSTSGADNITGFNTADTITGGLGNDTVAGGAGDDVYQWSRGDGSDLVSEGNSEGTGDKLVLNGVNAADVTVSHSGVEATLTVAGSGGAAIKVVFELDDFLDRGVEQVVLDDATWTRSDLRIKALATASTSGNDTIAAWGSNDTITGGGGSDVITGGGGADRIVYTAASDAPVGATPERIADFLQGTDKIDLSAIDANASVASDQAFVFVGVTAFSHTAGELRYDASPSGARTIFGDIDGDGLADFQIQVTGSTTLVSGDFLL